MLAKKLAYGASKAVTGAPADALRPRRPWQPLQRLAATAQHIVLQGFQRIEPNLAAIGLAGAVMFPAYWVVWSLLFPQPYENLPLRLAGAVLCGLLVVHRRLPDSWRRFLPVYWLGMLMLSLPFFFTFMMLQNGGSAVWVMSALSALFLLVLLVDWLSLLVLFLAGSLLGLLAHALAAPAVVLPDLYLEQLPVFIFALIGGIIFNYSAESLRQARRRAIADIGVSVAGEMRSPLSGVRTSAASLQRYLPTLLRAYEVARARDLPVAPLPQHCLHALAQVPERLGEEADRISAILDVLLIHAGNTDAAPAQMQFHSIGKCLDQALRQHVFASELERGKVRWRREDDFSFYGSDVMMKQLLGVALRRLLREVATRERGTLAIRSETTPDWNRLTFADSAAQGQHPLSGMLQTVLTGGENELTGDPEFDFCKVAMEQLGGRIACRREFGRITALSFCFPRTPLGRGSERGRMPA